MFFLILGTGLFQGIASVRIVSPSWREARIAAIGEGPWKAAYSIASLAALVLMIWGYSLARPEAPVLFEPPVWLKHVAVLLMLFAFILLAASVLPAGRLKAAARHPMLVAIKTWAVAHLLANGDLASIVLFGSFLAWAVADRVSVKRRGDMGPPPGPAVWDVVAVLIGFLAYILFLWRLHAWLFGVSPLA